MATAAAVAHRRVKATTASHNGRRTESFSPKNNKIGDDGGEVSLSVDEKNALRRKLLGETPVMRMQHFFRQKLFPRLHRENLADRLLFESQVLKGTGRLVNQIAIFALLILSLSMSSKHEAKRGIYDDLSSAFKFSELQGISNRRDFVLNCLPAITAKSKEYFVLSSQYFDPSSQGSVLFERNMKSFVRPLTYRPLELKSNSFTLSAWVQLSESFVEGWLFRKRTMTAGSDVNCWGWYLHNHNGPSLQYASHDYYSTEFHDLEELMSHHSGAYVDVNLGNETYLEPGVLTLLTVVVSDTNVSFYRDITLLGSKALPRVLTDCANNEEGVLLGSNGLQMGMVRYYPWAFAHSGVEELYEADGGHSNWAKLY